MSKDTHDTDQPPPKSDQVKRVLDEMERAAAAVEHLERVEERLRGRAPVQSGAAA